LFCLDKFNKNQLNSKLPIQILTKTAAKNMLSAVSLLGITVSEKM